MNKYILRWGIGDGITYHTYFDQPFITEDITKWEFDLLEMIGQMEEGQYEIIFNKITLPASDTEFDFEIFTLDKWFNINLI